MLKSVATLEKLDEEKENHFTVFSAALFGLVPVFLVEFIGNNAVGLWVGMVIYILLMTLYYIRFIKDWKKAGWLILAFIGIVISFIIPIVKLEDAYTDFKCVYLFGFTAYLILGLCSFCRYHSLSTELKDKK